MDKRLPCVPAVRLSGRVQLAAFFPTPGRGARHRSGQPSALMADVRVIVRRHIPIGHGNEILQKVANDIVLRRQQARKLRLREAVERALASDVLPLLEHPFDRGAHVAAKDMICKYVAGVCADPRLAKGGVQVLVLLDTFARTVLLRSLPCKPTRTNASIKTESGIAAAAPEEKARPFGVIGDGRRKQADERSKGEAEERWKGWTPWEGLIF